MFKKQQENLPMLDEEVASAIMNNVFEACGKTPSKVPLSVLSSYTEYRRDRFSLQKGILIFMLAVFLLLPLCFVSPSFRVSEMGRHGTGVPTYEVQVSNLIPIRLVSAKLDGRPVAVYESQAKVFTVEPPDNGTLTITVTLMNQQYDVWSTEVTGVDATAPVLISSDVQPDRIRVYVSDTGVGVDYDAVYAVSAADSRILPLNCNPDESYIEFTFPADLNIFVPDFNGNTLQLVLSTRSDGSGTE